MCVILACKNKKPSLEILRKCHNKNGDGAGVAWFNVENKAQYRKGLIDADEVHKFVQHLELPFVIHFRAASIGGKSLLLTHPFEISKESPLKLEGATDKLLFHNGHVSDWDMYLAAANIDRVPNDTMSDTRAMAMIVANDNTKFLQRAKGHYVVLDSKDQNFYLFGRFDDEDGIAYSNLFWKYTSSSQSHYRSGNNATTTYTPQGTAYSSDYYGEDGYFSDMGCCGFNGSGQSNKNTQTIPTIEALKGLSKKQRKKLLKQIKRKQLGQIAPNKEIETKSFEDAAKEVKTDATTSVSSLIHGDMHANIRNLLVPTIKQIDLAALDQSEINDALGFGS